MELSMVIEVKVFKALYCYRTNILIFSLKTYTLKTYFEKKKLKYKKYSPRPEDAL